MLPNNEKVNDAIIPSLAGRGYGHISCIAAYLCGLVMEHADIAQYFPI